MRRTKKRMIGAACLGAAVGVTGQSDGATVTLREGLNSYAGTQDTWFSNRTNGESNGFPESTFVRTAMWSAANQQALIRFDGLFGGGGVPLGSNINSAMLTLHVPSDITYADGEQNAVHQMLVDWAETDAFAAPQWTGGATQGIDLDGVEAVAASADLSPVGIIPQGTTFSYDVTSIVQNWSGGASNYGFLLQSLGLNAGNGLFMASSEYNGSGGETARPTLTVDFQSEVPTTLGIRVNTLTGNVSIFNETGASIDAVDYYRITSTPGALNESGWMSLEDQNLVAFPAGTGEGDGWEVLGVPSANALVEAYLQGNSSFADELLMSLGSAFSPGASTDDLRFLYRSSGNYFNGIVEFVATALEGDYNLDGRVDAADYTVWRDTQGTSGVGLAADGDGNGSVGPEDYSYWRARYGNTSNSAALTSNPASVPEPSSMLILGLGGVVFILVATRKPVLQYAVLPAVIVLMAVVPSANAEVANERNYTLGDDTLEDASAGITVGTGMNNVAMGQTLDSGDPGDPNFTFIDINVNGSPTYVDVTSRPGAVPNSLGASFNGSTDSLSTFFSMNRPSDFWDNITLFPSADYPFNYDTLLSHGVQLWAQPNPAGLGLGQRQDILIDTDDAGGVYITASDTWGLFFDETSIDSGVSVDTSGHGWTHVMHLAGLADPVMGRSAARAALLVNGVAVAASAGAYETEEQILIIGSNQDGSGNFYNGSLDEIRIFLWGDNTGVPDGFSGQMGQNYGALNLAKDNDWIAQTLEDMNVTDIADVNLDGVVFGNGTGLAEVDDVTAFIDGWLNVRRVNGVQVGDWISRQQGDLNYDGITDYKDAVLLHQGLVAAGAGGLNFGLLGADNTVPEPTTCYLLATGLICLGWYRQRNRHRA